MSTRDEKVHGLRGTPKDLPSVTEVKALLAENAHLKCVVCYARISFDGRAKDAHGVEDQHRDLSARAAQLGWLIVYRYTDNDKSASKESVTRDDFEQLLADLAGGHTPEGYPIHGVMAVNDDRLYRRPGDWERFLRAFTAHEERVYWDSNGLQDLYAEGFEIKGLLGVAMSLAETRKKQRRSRASHHSRALRGQSVAAWRPFGWDDDKLSLRPDEARAIRKAVHDVIAGASISEITRQWQEAGFRSARGNLFQFQSVKQVLLNARLCGYREVKGELVRDADGQPVEGEWEAIISPKEWFAVTGAMRSRGGGGKPAGPMVYKYLLTGILRCAARKDDGTICNQPMKGEKAASWVTYEHRYTCPKPIDGGCNGTVKRGDETDKHITKLVLAKLKEEAAAVQKDIPEWSRATELDRLTTSRTDLEQRWQHGELDNESFFRLLAGLESQIKELRADQARHLALQAAAEAATVDIEEEWTRSTLTQKRAMIKKVLHAVIAVPSGRGSRKFNVDLLTPVWRSGEQG